jgi:hypothetical protein
VWSDVDVVVVAAGLPMRGLEHLFSDAPARVQVIAYTRSNSNGLLRGGSLGARGRVGWGRPPHQVKSLT